MALVYRRPLSGGAHVQREAMVFMFGGQRPGAALMFGGWRPAEALIQSEVNLVLRHAEAARNRENRSEEAMFMKSNAEQ